MISFVFFYRLLQIETRFNQLALKEKDNLSQESFDKLDKPRGASNKFGEGASPAIPNQIPALTPSDKKSSGGGTDKCVLFNTSNTTSDEDKDQRNGEIDDKQALIPMQSQAPLAKVAESEDTSTLTIDNIVAHVWQRHKQKAQKLLKALSENPKISFNSKGQVTLDRNFLSDTNIQHLIEICFYTNKSYQVKGLNAWVAFLKDNQLYQFVTNPRILIGDHAEWWFLGTVPSQFAS